MSSKPFIPLIHLPTRSSDENDTQPCKDLSKTLVDALQTSGFLLVTKKDWPKEDWQCEALKTASIFLLNSKDQDEEKVIAHPSDPKSYAMLHSIDECKEVSSVLAEYMTIMQQIKIEVLEYIAVGLGISRDFFSRLHTENNDTLRLINYKPGSDVTGNRCKEHSDYGTITLLSTDGVSGLEAYHEEEGQWVPVPHVDGALVVNIGSLLSGWTKGSLRATLHRVAGPSSLNSLSPKEDLLTAVRSTRTSIAFFADPNTDITETLKKSSEKQQDDGLVDALNGMSVTEYIQWRSGGNKVDRTGVDFTRNEKEIIGKTSISELDDRKK